MCSIASATLGHSGGPQGAGGAGASGHSRLSEPKPPPPLQIPRRAALKAASPPSRPSLLDTNRRSTLLAGALRPQAAGQPRVSALRDPPPPPWPRSSAWTRPRVPTRTPRRGRGGTAASWACGSRRWAPAAAARAHCARKPPPAPASNPRSRPDLDPTHASPTLNNRMHTPRSCARMRAPCAAPAARPCAHRPTPLQAVTWHPPYPLPPPLPPTHTHRVAPASPPPRSTSHPRSPPPARACCSPTSTPSEQARPSYNIHLHACIITTCCVACVRTHACPST